MTLDEAIKHAEEVAKQQEEIAWEAQLQEEYGKIKSCKKCAEEHRQLAEWLKDYKRLKEQEPCEDIKEYYKDIWDCDINHPRYEDTVAEIVEKSYMSGYVQGVENMAKEFRFELEQEPYEDTISRHWLMDCVNEGWIKFDTEKDKNRFIHLVRDMAPPAQPEQCWIPVNERLPEENKTVMASTEYGVYRETKYTKEYGWEGAYEYGEDCWVELAGVIAWMPLPKPYKTESEEEKE